MTYPAREASNYSGQPYELYLFQSATEVWRYTSGDVSRTYLGQVYNPEAIHRTETDQNGETKSGTIKIELPRQNDLATRFVSSIPSSPISLVIFRGHDGDADVVVNFTGKVSVARYDDFCELEVTPEQDAIRRRIPVPKFQRPCNRILYDKLCGVDKTLWRTTGTLSSIAGDLITSSAFATHPDGYFVNGYVEKAEERQMVIAHTGVTLQLLNPFTSNVQPGDSVNAYRGCQRNEADCASFSNLPNHFGFSKIPTRNPFDSLE